PDPADGRFPFLRDEDIDALLVGNERRLRNDHLFLWGTACERDAHQLAVDQRKIGIWKFSARQDGIGGAVHGQFDEIYLAGMLVRDSVRKKQGRFDAGNIDGVSGLLGVQEFTLADGKGHVHRILADDDGQRTGFRTDDIADGDVGLADLACDGRVGLSIAEMRRGSLTSPRCTASTQPTKSSVLVMGFRSAVTTPTGIAGCCWADCAFAKEEAPRNANKV